MSLVSFHGSEAELEKLVADPGSKVLYFTASWCPPCRMIAPAFQKMSEEFSSIEFIKIDIDDYGDAASGYDVRSVPTFIFLKGPAIKSQVSHRHPMMMHFSDNMPSTVLRCQ